MPTGPLKRLCFEADTGLHPEFHGCGQVLRVLWNGIYVGRVLQSRESATWGNDQELGTYPWKTPEEASFHLIGRNEVTRLALQENYEWNVYLADTGGFWMGPFPSREEAERAVHTTAGFDLPFASQIRQDPVGTAKNYLTSK
ncbi:MAG TPA: hypothetical protein PLB18_02245 [Acidobacteriota bacterium]|nr:hypothetical protein [Acidobacteriota bacterium]HND18162.1 hypothetical protein [Acidobacteriota bacterium]HNG93529.1 hypothetical protein [Acidobacteriota bacterium]HNH82768.1 hypothetical protein [Acidobacteriota bacterium]HNJ43754.1 hypothetical protein [Acidobacteriota bacterium]